MTHTSAAEQEALLATDPAQRNDDTRARVGAIVRELHDALNALGATAGLQRVIREIPDARSRLSYVGEMTEKAAHRVLGLVDHALPKAMAHAAHARRVSDLVASAAAAPNEGAEGYRRMLEVCGDLSREGAAFAAEQQQVLSDIMLTQDFQDLSGQVIKKVIDMISRTEHQLVALLIDTDGDSERSSEPLQDAALEGPQTPDNALAQDDVDDLLASMGF